ncbi:MAG: SGNH/GDSL hydrolase family protein [Candidatus Odinarchaeota archaeon]
MNILTIVSAVMLFLVMIAILTSLYIYYQATKKPDNNPSQYLKRKGPASKDKRVIIAIGDSITHGRIGTNYVNILKERFNGKKSFEFVNAGINSELAWNAVQRLGEIINCNPYIVTILIGTNDANAALGPENMKDHVKRMKLPRDPTRDWYRKMLTILATRLKQETRARIALLSLPTIGEEPGNRVFIQSTEYSAIVKEVAERTGCSYIPLHEKMVAYLNENPSKPKYPYEKGRTEMIKTIVRYYLFRKNWDAIAMKSGFELHIDYLHLNSRGASMVADLIEEFIEKEEKI